jgi:hypothetical protein
MKPLLFGAVLALLWLLLGLPSAPVASLWEVAAQPVTIAFVLGLAARPYVARGRWSR